MDDLMSKARDRFYSEFNQMYSKAATEEKWSKDCVETMKNLLKCIYYVDVIDAMHNPEEYDSDAYSRHSYAMGRSGAQHRDSMGRYASRDGGYGVSGRRYYNSYDEDRHAAMDRLQALMNTESNNEVRMALQNVMNEMNMR